MHIVAPWIVKFYLLSCSAQDLSCMEKYHLITTYNQLSPRVMGFLLIITSGSSQVITLCLQTCIRTPQPGKPDFKLFQVPRQLFLYCANFIDVCFCMENCILYPWIVLWLGFCHVCVGVSVSVGAHLRPRPHTTESCFEASLKHCFIHIRILVRHVSFGRSSPQTYIVFQDIAV